MAEKAATAAGASAAKTPPKLIEPQAIWLVTSQKNIVAAGLADACEIQLSYVIGVAQPVSVFINTGGTAKISEQKISRIVRDIFPLKPKEMIAHLKLARPIFAQTSYGGHFGRKGADFTWEKTDMAQKLRKAAGL